MLERNERSGERAGAEKVITIHMDVGTTIKRKEAAVAVEKKERNQQTSKDKNEEDKMRFFGMCAGELRMKENRKRRKMCTLHTAQCNATQ